MGKIKSRFVLNREFGAFKVGNGFELRVIRFESKQEAQLTLWVADRTAPVIQVQSRGTYLRGRRGR